MVMGASHEVQVVPEEAVVAEKHLASEVVGEVEANQNHPLVVEEEVGASHDPM